MFQVYEIIATAFSALVMPLAFRSYHRKITFYAAMGVISGYSCYYDYIGMLLGGGLEAGIMHIDVWASLSNNFSLFYPPGILAFAGLDFLEQRFKQSGENFSFKNYISEVLVAKEMKESPRETAKSFYRTEQKIDILKTTSTVVSLLISGWIVINYLARI